MDFVRIFAVMSVMSVLAAQGAGECCGDHGHGANVHKESPHKEHLHEERKGHDCKDHDHKDHDHKDHGHKDHDHKAHDHGGHDCKDRSHGGRECGGNGAGAFGDGAEVVEIGERALESMGLSVVHPQKRRMRSTLSLVGRMELASDARKGVPAPVEGKMSLKVREFDNVKKGDVLFDIDSPGLKTLSREIKVLEERLEVYRRLETANAEISAELKVKIARKESLVAGLEEKNGVVSVRSTVDAMVEKIASADGSWVETGTEIATLVRPHHLRFRAIAVASEAAKLRDSMVASVGGVEAETRIGVGGNDGMVPVYAVFGDGKAPGRAGDRLTAEFVLDESEGEVVAVPDDCIVVVGAEPVVFAKDATKPGRFFAVKVRTGTSSGGWTAVDGLPGDGHLEIVKNGAYELKLQLSAKSGEKPVGHFHSDGTFHEGEH